MASQAIEQRRNAADILGGNAHARGVAASQSTTVEQSRAIAEVQGALLVAHNRPRDKARALNEALESCRTREVAEGAFFKFSRGGSTVAGETIHLARELARCWGNIIYDVIELERDDEKGHSEMLARAWDLETNAQSRITFIVPHLRDKKGGPTRLTDVRDIYENNANMGARRLRECIFAVLPPYLVKSAADECRYTLERGESEEPLPVRIGKLLTAFAQIGIDKARIEAKHGPVDRFTPVDLANIAISYKSIRRGEIMAEEEFPRIEGAAPQVSKLDALEQAIQPGNDKVDAMAHAEGRSDEQHGDQFDSTDQPPTYAAWLETAFERIAAATKPADLRAVESDPNKDALPDDVLATLEEAIADKRKALLK